MFLNKLTEMSVGPLWVLRNQPSAGQSTQRCKVCGMPWLQAGSENGLAILPAPLRDPLHEALLQNCLHAAGLGSGSIFTLHQSCAEAAQDVRLALQNQLNAAQPEFVIVFGSAAALALDSSLVRGQVHQFQNVRLVVTHHPEEMIANPALKAQVWADLCLIHAN